MILMFDDLSRFKSLDESSRSFRAAATDSRAAHLLDFIGELCFPQPTFSGLSIFSECSDKRGSSYRGPHILTRELLKSLPRHLLFVPRENHGSKTVGEGVFSEVLLNLPLLLVRPTRLISLLILIL